MTKKTVQVDVSVYRILKISNFKISICQKFQIFPF